MGRTGRGVSASRRIVRVSEGDLRAGARGKLAELFVRVAAEFLRAAVDCFGMHRVIELSGVVLAGAGERADCGVACAALCELRCGGCVLAGDGAALSESELDHAAGMGAVRGSDGGTGGRDCVRICARGGDRWMAYADVAGAVRCSGAGRIGAGNVDCDLRLLGLLQHHVSGQRGEAAGADDSAGDSAVGAVCYGTLRDHEPGRAALDAGCCGARESRPRSCGCNWWPRLHDPRLDNGRATRLRRW